MSLTTEDKAWITEELEKREKRRNEAEEKQEARLIEAMRRIETTLLTEFHEWAHPAECA